MQPILGSKSAKSAYSPSCFTLVFQNGLEYRNADFKRLYGTDLATLYKHLVNFGLKNSGVYEGVHPLVDQQFTHVRLAAPLLDTAAIITEFCGAISTQFCFTHSLGGVTAMPRGLH